MASRRASRSLLPRGSRSSLTARARRRGIRRRSVRRLRIGAALAIGIAALLAFAGCAPASSGGGDVVLTDVKKAIIAADPDIADVTVESARDGLARVLAVNVAIADDAIDGDRLSALLKATVDTRGASDFSQLHFSVWTPDLNGGLVDLSDPADELGLSAADKTISDDVATVKSKLG
ncbi:hypothetical protein GCM10027515_05490 [Schumannella luteola]|uniref:Uncharacterized protein n=1 Tax=Schumannella luteola TaxID=472059 RepID=A0A852YH04_9MICO|nr:hypothetical protein [Schumannella luteola]NYG98318.1 hypothetical protein [Schumannella luteola]TPX05748.1 hypothetical protein FJ656_04780 [Schumannella luteola]